LKRSLLCGPCIEVDPTERFCGGASSPGIGGNVTFITRKTFLKKGFLDFEKRPRNSSSHQTATQEWQQIYFHPRNNHLTQT